MGVTSFTRRAVAQSLRSLPWQTEVASKMIGYRLGTPAVRLGDAERAELEADQKRLDQVVADLTEMRDRYDPEWYLR